MIQYQDAEQKHDRHNPTQTPPAPVRISTTEAKATIEIT